MHLILKKSNTFVKTRREIKNKCHKNLQNVTVVGGTPEYNIILILKPTSEISVYSFIM